jgi:hypothetical protein
MYSATAAPCIDGLRLAAHDGEQDGRQVGAVEGLPEGTQLIQDASQGPHVALLVIPLPLAHLRGQVVRGACTMWTQACAQEHVDTSMCTGA